VSYSDDEYVSYDCDASYNCDILAYYSDNSGMFSTTDGSWGTWDSEGVYMMGDAEGNWAYGQFYYDGGKGWYLDSDGGYGAWAGESYVICDSNDVCDYYNWTDSTWSDYSESSESSESSEE